MPVQRNSPRDHTLFVGSALFSCSCTS